MPSARVRRLVNKTQFSGVLGHPPIAHTSHFALHYLQATPPLFDIESAAWAGVVLPKRWAKRAVTRNGIRRQIYHSLHNAARAGNWTQGAVVVRLRRGFDVQQFPSAWSSALSEVVRSELQRLLQRARITT